MSEFIPGAVINTRIFPCPFDMLHCDVFNCTNSVKWYIGDPTGPESANYKVCDECAHNIVATLPDELISKDAAEPSMENPEEAPEIKSSFDSSAVPDVSAEDKPKRGRKPKSPKEA